MTTTTPPIDSPPQTDKTRPLLSRRWDVLLVVGAALLIAGAFHINQMLFAGDWSFWADWKDREFWPLVTPSVGIIIPAAVQYITWDRLRLPLGATLCAVVLLLTQWLSRWGSFDLWAGIPLNFTWPETFILAAILLDVTLLVTKSYLLTSVIGGLIWGGLFWFFNFPALSPFLSPVDFHGTLLTVADTMSFHIGRTQTPEYLRMIEEGHLKSLVGNITIVVSFFSGMLCAATYWIGLAIGKYLAVKPTGKFFKLTTD
ncbi:methane monooxygenase/ammonia monooxygenase subunit A [Rhodococcus sp. WAY2]|uniref:methane monooxygenase/ammonia monooxygenase subunit A n=1 Tax=Rhodococcus sp. WAY2 TaxID=2663121 RepID=UPI001356D61D|nr:methane monooxygenase/ammonia monooxygenase subunit A [Rhodococcus sp. WAY2]